jgi:hypothetical protein
MKTFAQFYVVKALICLAGFVYLLLAHGQLSEVLLWVGTLSIPAALLFNYVEQ